MAKYGGLQDRGWVRAAQTRFGMPPDYDLSLMPEVALTIAFEAPEMLWHQGWRRYSRGFQVGAVAAQNGQARIGLQSTSTSILVLEKVVVSTAGAAGQVTYNTGTAIGSTSLGTIVANTAAFRDGRFPFGIPDAQTSLTTTAAPFTVSGTLLDFLANTPIELPGGPWVLTPGTTLTIQDQIVNQSLDITFVWRERILQEQENTP